MKDRIVSRLLFVGILFGVFVGLAEGACPAGDLNGDCIVDFEDLLMFAGQWLDDPGAAADLVGGDGVDIADYGVLAGNWLVEGVPLVINEFMASNSVTYSDGQGQFDDWIEIYNPSSVAIDIGGMYLTDDISDKTKYMIPEGLSGQTTIAPKGYLVLWADEDIIDGPLHLGFKLNADGEEIGLFDKDGESLIDSVVFGDQTADVSYGRTTDGGDVWHTLTASANASNDGKILYLVAPPVFSIKSKAFSGYFNLGMTVDDPEALIRYTKDGSAPSPTHGYTYNSQISILETSVIKAIAYKPGIAESEIVVERYIELANDVDDFTSNLPIVLVDNYGAGAVPDEPKQEAFMLIYEPDGSRSSLAGEHVLDCRIGIERRGSSTLGQAKGQYGVEVWDEQGKDKNISPLGMPSESDWILHAPYRIDRTLMRNVLMYELSNQIDRYAVRTRFVEVFFNKDNDVLSYSDYVGVYVFMEKIKRDTDRVDIAKLEVSDNTLPAIEGGYILRHDRPKGDSTFTTSAGLTIINEYPKLGTITSTQKTWIKNYVQSFENALYSGTFTDPVTGYRATLDDGAAVDHNLLNMFSMNADALRLSAFMYKDRGGKLIMGPLWDMNISLGTTYDPWGNRVWNPIGWRGSGDGTDYFGYGWWGRLFEDDEFSMSYVDRWFDLRESVLSLNNINGLIDGMIAELNEAQVRNFVRWPETASSNYGNWQGEVDHLKDWISQRVSWIDSQMAVDFALTPPSVLLNNSAADAGGNADVDDIVALANPNGGGTIYYTTDGSDPRLWGGGVNSSALAYEAVGDISTTFITKGAVWSYLDDGSDQGTAWRETGFNDNPWDSGNAELGYGDGGEQTVVGFVDIDPVEDDIQKNPTTYFRTSFNVSNASLFDSLNLSLLRDDGAVVYLNGTEVARDKMPAGAIDYRTFASDVVSGSDESTFYALGSVDTQLLIDGANVLAVEIHQNNFTSSDISFDLELTATVSGSGDDDEIVLDQSTRFKSRVLDGGNWSALNEATFAVGPVAEILRITEIMYHPAGDPNSEFIEFKNIGAESINLNLVKFTNGVDFTFPAIDLAAGEFVLVVKNTTAFNAQYPTFSGTIAGQFAGALDNDGDRVRLEDAIGTIIHDFKFKDGWYSITDGGGFTLTVSNPATATLYEEKDTWRASTNAGGTPGTEDVGPNTGDIVVNELLAHSDDAPNDWIELYNTSGAEINISGWYLSDNNNDDPNLMKYRIAEGTTIAADGYIVFTQDEHFGSSFALSENGEKVCLTSAAGGVLTGYRETESFGASEVGVSLGRYYKASTDTYNFVAMSSITDGSANAYPKVGPIVISEIMYNPAAGGTYDNDQYEFVELYNVSGSAVMLYDNDLNLGWTFTDGIDYTFASGTTIAPNSRLVIARNIAAFTECYGYSAGILGPFANDTKLSNGGERLQIGKPGDTDESGTRYYIRMDRVAYSDGSHPIGEDPWPTEADGGGDSLKRITLTNYGNDHVNWQASTASPDS